MAELGSAQIAHKELGLNVHGQRPGSHPEMVEGVTKSL